MISLANLSLSVIAADFERFHHAFLVLNNENQKRNFEFLQRRYSYEIISELDRIRKLKDKYLDFLINEHLKIFNENWLTDSSYRNNSMKDILCRLPNLTKISCLVATDEILKNIAEFCSKIVEICAHFSKVTDQGIRYLCESENGCVPCPELKKLSIGLHGLTIDGFKCIIRNLKYVEGLNYEKFSLALFYLHKKDLPELKEVPKYNFVRLNLYILSESVPQYGNLLKICLTVCPKLKSLTCSITDEEQLSLFSNIYLENLKISFRTLQQKINIDNFLKICGRNLINLTVYYCIMSNSQLAISCPKLQDLTEEDVSFTDDGDSEVIFQNLEQCSFSRIESNELNEKAMSRLLLSSPKLKYINFNSCHLSSNIENEIVQCCENRRVQEIYIGSTRVELNFLRDLLTSCPSLETLFLEEDFYQSHEVHELLEFAKTLLNKPHLIFCKLLYTVNCYRYKE